MPLNATDPPPHGVSPYKPSGSGSRQYVTLRLLLWRFWYKFWHTFDWPRNGGCRVCQRKGFLLTCLLVRAHGNTRFGAPDLGNRSRLCTVLRSRIAVGRRNVRARFLQQER